MKSLILATVIGLTQLPPQVQYTSTDQNLSILRDQAGTDHTLVASSNYPYPAPQSPPDGLHYVAKANPSITPAGAIEGQYFVLIPDIPPQSGATLNIDNIGPIPIQGTCVQECFILAFGNPVNSFITH